ncbi:MAG TPA: prepilin-type N-terminal cleavage/methylation domain-containing protein [Candidatus Anammoximicrobium sp.]|nr:prepilin-type N-terminal cleavage/methylation domain-containing protein [Candidatus Anammoximicrobium sp.]
MTRNRRGTTLIEMLVIISVCSVVMGASGVLLHGMYRADKENRLQIANGSAVARLSLQFRRDAHAAGEAELLKEANGKAAGLVFRGSFQPTIEYRQQGRAIVRTAKQGDKVVHMDSFALPAGTEFNWTLEEGQPSVAAVQIARPARRGGKLDALFPQRIEAVVGIVPKERLER